MNKCHTNVGWRNDTTPAINETNLNYMDGCIDTIDDRVISLDTTKADQSNLLLAFKDVSLDANTGVITFTLFNNTTKTIDTLLEKVAINFDYDDNPQSAHYQSLIITLQDGTVKYIDMSALITQYEFVNSSTVAFTVGNDGSISASVVDGSITANKLQPNYLADVTAQAQAASAAATAASGSASDAADSAEDSEAWAVGQRGGVDVDPTDPAYHNNAKYWKDQAQEIAGGTFEGLSDVNITSPTNGQVPAFNSTSGKWENTDIAIDARDVSYDNTDSGLAATDVQGAIDEVAGALHEEEVTVTGNPLSFTTDSEQVAKNTVITFEPIQAGSGVPSPSNVRAISGYDSVDIAVTDGESISIKLNETLYGGTLDVESGKLVVTHKAVDMGNLNWGISTGYDGGRVVLYAKIEDKKPGSNPFISSRYAYLSNGGYSTGIGYISDSSAGSYKYHIFVGETGYTSGADFKTAITGQMVVYKLETPITIQLSPAQVKLLQGANVVTTNGTSMSLTYRNGEVAKLSDLSGFADSINADVVKASNRNLLDNPWFTVNQRGFTSRSGDGTYNIVDRWFIYTANSSASVTLNNNMLTLAATSEAYGINLRQKMYNDLTGAKVTLSVLFSDGTIESATSVGTVPAKTSSQQDVIPETVVYGGKCKLYFRVAPTSNTENYIVQIFATAGNSITIKAVKLEKSSTSTLYHDIAPNIDLERMKCQGYLVRYTGEQNAAFALGVVRNSSEARCLIPLSVPLRATPTVRSGGSFKFIDDNSVTTLSVTGFGLSTTLLNAMNIYAAFSGGTAGHSGRLLADSAGAYIEFDTGL